MPTHQSYLLSCLPTAKYRKTIFPAVEYGMRNLMCHNKGRTLSEVVWEINAEENISMREQVIKEYRKLHHGVLHDVLSLNILQMT